MVNHLRIELGPFTGKVDFHTRSCTQHCILTQQVSTIITKAHFGFFWRPGNLSCPVWTKIQRKKDEGKAAVSHHLSTFDFEPTDLKGNRRPLFFTKTWAKLTILAFCNRVKRKKRAVFIFPCCKWCGCYQPEGNELCV